MSRIQSGYIYEASDAFFVRYYVTEIVDGAQKRVQRSERLCSKDAKYYAKNAKVVKLLRDEFMLTVNQQAPGHIKTADVTIINFWEKTYLPFANENLRHSTMHGYRQIWGQHLASHFASLTLKEYRTHIGSQFLTSLSKTLGRHTLQHIRSLASGIFSHAVNTGLIESNPWHDVRILGKVKAPKGTKHYTLEEAENVISALVDRVDCQLIVALAFFLGLRPGEIAALQWGDVDATSLHIRRATARGVVGECKTESSVATLPLINPVRVPMKLWHEKSGDPTEGWIFPGETGELPLSLESLTARVIVPILKASKIEWKGLYAGRRGAGSVLTKLTGDALAAQQILRHKNLAVTTAFYVKQLPEAGLSGMKLLEEASSKSTGQYHSALR